MQDIAAMHICMVQPQRQSWATASAYGQATTGGKVDSDTAKLVSPEGFAAHMADH